MGRLSKLSKVSPEVMNEDFNFGLSPEPPWYSLQVQLWLHTEETLERKVALLTYQIERVMGYITSSWHP